MSMPPTAVKMAVLAAEPVDETSTYMGTARSRKSAVLQPRVSGNIISIFAHAGDFVSPGAALVQIDPEKQAASVLSFDAANRSSAADRQTAEHNLHSLEATEISKIANMKFLEQEVQRYTWLSTQGAVAKETVDDFWAKHRSSEGELQSVQAQIRAQKSAIAKMDQMVKQTAASAKEQKVQLRYYTVTAPFAGTVGDIPLKLGEYVDSTTKITTVTENRPLEVYISVPAEKAAALRKGMLVRLSDSDGTSVGDATIFFISPVADETQTVTVKALYDNSSERLRSNQTVTAKIVWKRDDNLVVPTYAVSHVSGQDFVFVADGNGTKMVAKQKPVVLGEIVGNNYVVKSGLQAGERLITSGVQSLIDGAPIAPQS
jgi:multidrug efflux pump subunit AcrA (membrane-fusion protein)